jgi:hypothetical protein
VGDTLTARVEEAHHEDAARMRRLLATGRAPPAVCRAALTAVAPDQRDAWLDRVFGLDELPDDGPELPRGCVPYLPCGVDAVLRMVDHADVQPGDVFVDIGAGIGRAAVLTHFLTGAAAIGIEIQPALVGSAHDLTRRLNASRVTVIEGDAVRLTGSIPVGSVFFLYCPFSGARLDRVLDDLESIAMTRQIRVCCVDLPLPTRPWLRQVSPPAGDLVVYQSARI